MEEIELRLVTNNSQAVKGVRELAAESDKLYKNNEKNQKREKGLIADIEDEMVRLQKARRDAFRIEDVEKYNRKIAEAKQGLKEYEEAGLKADQKTKSLTESIGKWALSLGGAAMALKLVKDAVLATTTGINAFNIAGAVAKQVMYNLVTGSQSLTAGLGNVIAAQKKLNELRIQDKIDTYNAKIQLVLYNKALVEAKDQTRSITDRIKSYDDALAFHNKAIDIEIESARAQVKAYSDILDVSPDNEKAKLAFIDFNTKIIDLEINRNASMKEISSMRSGMIKKEIDDELKWRTDLHNDLQKLADEQIKIDEENSKKRIEDNKKFWEDYDKWFEDNLEKIQSEPEKIDAFFKEWERQTELDIKRRERNLEKDADIIKQFFADWERETEIDIAKRRKLLDEDEELKNQRIEALKDTAFEIADALSGITQRNFQDAQRNRQILDDRISETQRSLDQEIQLYEAGYASNVAAKQKELDNLKVIRDKALKDEEAARKKMVAIESLIQSANLVTSATSLIKQGAKLGPIGLAIAAASIAAMFALFSSIKGKASSATKLASGGHGEVTGRLHSQGGESFLSHVEVEQGERWGVLSRPASRRYGKAFGQMVDSFNRNQLVIPKTGTVNNILLDTSMTNGRLERVESQLIKLNQYFEGQETMSDNGRISVQKKGSTTRIIKHR